MQAASQFSIFRLPVCYPKVQRLTYTELQFYLSFIWAWILVSHIEGRTYADGVWENGTEKDTWACGKGKRGVEKIEKRGASCAILLTKYYTGHQIKNKMGWACSSMGEKCIQRFSGITWGRETLGDLSVDGRIILKWISRSGMGVWTGLVWLKTGAGGGRFWMR
jgi:hypothetical protein